MACVAQALCPAGRFGEAAAETSPNCTGRCAPGYECPAGSTSATDGVCPAGYYCEGGPRQPCPAGRYSSATGTVSAVACVPCLAGRYSRAVAATSEATCAPCAPFDGSSSGAVACWPGLVSAIAGNPPPVTPGFSVGDTVTLTFSAPTNTSAEVVFSPPIGTTAMSWRTGNRELRFTVVSAAGVNVSAVDVATGSLSVTVSGLRSADGTSPASPEAVVIVGGTWGVPAPPVIVGVTAADGGRNPGPGTNDTLLVAFDQAVRQVPGLHTPAGLADVLAFLPPLPVGVAATGAWVSPFELRVTLVVATGSVANFSAWNVGRLAVAVRATANLTSANGESGSSNSSAVVAAGSWGDGLGVSLSPRNASAVVVALTPPPTAVGYSTDVFVVQWSTSASFAGTGSVPDTVAGVQAWATLGSSFVPVVDSRGRAVGSAVMLRSSTAAAAVDTAVFSAAGGQGASLSPPLQFDVTGLLTSTTYFVRGACNGPVGVMGPVVPAEPGAITPQPPLVTLVTAPSVGLPTQGGVVLDVEGDQLGATDSMVLLTLTSTVFGAFVSSPCRVVTPGSRLRCVSPPGIGGGLVVTVDVDGIASQPYPNATLWYTAPSITGLRVIAGGSDGSDGVSTSGGGLVEVDGVNFGPAALGWLSLGAVTYSPVAYSVAAGMPVVFPALNCAITRNHTQLTCGMGSGVGGGLQWSVTVAGQTASTVTSGYRAPVLAAVGVLTRTGVVDPDPSALQALDTRGGQLLVCTGRPDRRSYTSAHWRTLARSFEVHKPAHL
jgi:hypothetical protein